MKRLDDWFPALSSRPDSLDAKGHSEQGSRDTQETIVFPTAWLASCAYERSDYRAETQAASLLAAKQASDHYLRPVWLRMNED